MTFLELLLTASCLLSPLFLREKNKGMSNYFVLSVISLTFLIHLGIDGLRWQMTPIYMVLLLLVLLVWKGKSLLAQKTWINALRVLLVVIFLSIGVLLSSIMPIFSLPSISGNYAVGSNYLHLASDQEEVITSEPSDFRELMIKVWYPAKIENEAKETYLTPGDRGGFSLKYGLPLKAFNYLKRIKTNTYEEAELVEGKFPILIFSHGQYAMANGYYSLLENIASNGFIVLGINHTYESVGSEFPSGEVKFYNKEYDQKHNNENMAEMIWKSMESYKQAKSLADKTDASYDLLKNYFAAEITRRWSKDIDLVIDQLEKWNQTSFLSGHLDINKVGVMGHSQGGAAVVQAMLENHKIKAGANIDGAQWGDVVDSTISKPFLLLASDWPTDHPDFNEVVFQNGTSSDFYKAKIRKSGHSSFMDIPYIINLKALNESGSIDKVRASTISSDLIIVFFQKYLNGEEVDIEELAKKYPELEIQKVN